MTLTQIKPAGLSKPVDLADNEKIRLGTGNDLQIYHDDGKSYIKNTTLGSIFINSVSHTYIANSDNSEYYAKFHGNGSAQLFFDNSKKFETTSAGVSVEGQVRLTDDNSLIVRPTSSAIAFNTGGSERLRINSSGHVKLPDTKELQLGGPLNSGNGDLRIYHDGTHSYITNNTGTLYNFANTWIINNYDNSENFIRAFNNGAVELYYDGSKKLETISTGVYVTGDVESTTGIFERTNNGTSQLEFSSTSSTKLKHLSNGQCKLEFIGYNSVFGGAIDAQTNSDYIRILTGANEQAVKCNSNGAVELYYDNSKKLHTTSTGIYVTGNIQLPDDGELKLGNSGDLSIYHNDGLGSSWIYNSTGELHIRSDSIFLRSTSDGASYVNCTDNGAVDLYYNGSKKLATSDLGVTISGGLNLEADSTNNTGDAGLYVRSQTSGDWGLIVDKQNSSEYGAKVNVVNSTNFALAVRDTTNNAHPFRVNGAGKIICGGGIVLGAGQSENAANLLDDYEEGTFTPVYGWGSSSQSGFSTSQNYGRYTKIGRVVHISIWTNWSATPSSGDSVQVQLPFSSANDGGYRGGMSFSWNAITYVGQSSTTQGGRTHLNQNTTWMELGFRSDVNGGGWSSSAILPANMANNAHIQLEGVYMTNT